MIPSSATPPRAITALLVACGLLTVGVATLVWVNSRRLAHYNDEINDLRRHVTTADGQVQRLSQKLEDCLYLKKMPDSLHNTPLRTTGWE